MFSENPKKLRTVSYADASFKNSFMYFIFILAHALIFMSKQNWILFRV